METMKSVEPYPTENMIEDLKEIIKEMENDTFEGCLVYACHNKEQAWAKMVKGQAQDRLVLVDAALMSMQYDPIEESRNWFFVQIYERFKRLRPSSLRDSDRTIV